MKTFGYLLVAFMLSAKPAFSQGPLVPPGAPGETMKSLDQIEPRRTISALPYTITESGSYYLTGNLSGATGIVVSASHVTLDLMGFTLTGEPYGVGISGGGGVGIGSDPLGITPPTDIRVVNGHLTGWETAGIHLFTAAQVRIESVAAVSNAIGIVAGPSATFVDCLVAGSTAGVGFYAGANAVLRGCRSEDNAGIGIVTGNGAVISDCTVRNNGASGIQTGEGSLVFGCTVVDNDGHGITVAGNAEVRDNRCDGNGAGQGGAAIRATGSGSRIENNRCVGSDTGITIVDGGNRLNGNRVFGNANNYAIAQGNRLDLLLGEVPETLPWPCHVTFDGTLASTQTDVPGITVAADDVTIDLAGHALVGPGSPSHSGIFQDSAFRNLTVRNGTVSDWRGGGEHNRAGIEAMGAATTVSHVHVLSNHYGVNTTGTNSVVQFVSAIRNEYGIRVGVGSLVKNCVANENADLGFYLFAGSTIADSKATANGGHGFQSQARCTFRGCKAHANGLAGFSSDRASMFNACTASDNGSEGFFTSYHSVVIGCTAIGNNVYGFLMYTGCIRDSVASVNVGTGIFMTWDGMVLNNTVTYNRNNDGEGSGIMVNARNRVEGNTVMHNDRGYYSDGDGNFFSRNTAAHNTKNWEIAAGNYCLVVKATASGAISGDSGGTSPGSTNPNANFTH